MCTQHRDPQQRDPQSGFSLAEMVYVLGIIATLAIISVPGCQAFAESQRARGAALLVEQELQQARLKAVSTSSPLRVRLNCPLPGQLRTLEVTGVATTDNDGNRCDPTAYPYPGPNDSLRSTPALDSAVVLLPSGTIVSSTILNFQFDPEGNVSAVSSGGAVTPITADVVMTVTRGGWSHTVTINQIGRVRLD